jgi:hypothetical protein
MFHWLTVVVITAALLIGTPPSPSRADTCQEDQACWDCETMGNQVCGPRILVCQPTERDGQLYLDQCDWYDRPIAYVSGLGI